MARHARVDIGKLLLDHRRIEAAMRAAYRRAILDHRRTGHSMAFWRDGRVVWIDAKDLPLPKPDSSAA